MLTSCSTVPWEARVQEIVASKAGTKVLVTGAAGFIGSHVAEYCAKTLKFKVVAVDDLSGGFIENVPKEAIFVKGDLKDPEFVARLFKEHGPFEYVYHLAAYDAEGLSHFIRRYNYRNNLEASVSMLNEAVKQQTKVFVFTSSIAAFGVADVLPMTENTPQRPEDPFGIAKHSMELDLKAAHHMFGIDYVIFRPHNVYGPRQNIADKFRNAIGIFMNQLLRGEPMTIFGDGLQTRAFSYIDDVAPIIAVSPTVAAARNEAFFVGSDIEYSVKDLATHVAEALNKPATIKFLDARNEVQHAYAVHDKMRCFFNPLTPVTLRDGLARTAAFVLSHGASEPVGYEDIEVPLRMPPSWVIALQEWRKHRDQKAAAASSGAASGDSKVGSPSGPFGVNILVSASSSPYYPTIAAFAAKSGFNEWCSTSAFSCDWTGEQDHVGPYVKLTMLQKNTNDQDWVASKAVPVAGFAVLSDPRKYSRRSINSIDFPIRVFRLAITGQHEELVMDMFGALKEAPTLTKMRKLIVTFHDSNIGCAAGWNRVMQADPSAPWYLVMNNDIAFPAGVLAKIHHNMHANLALDPVRNGFAVFGLPDLALYSTFAISAQVIEKAGYFDENIWPVFFEDNDYTARLHCAGISAVQYDDCPLLHNEALGKNGAYVSGSRLVDSHGPDINRAMAVGEIFIGQKWGGKVPCNVKGVCKPSSCSPYREASRSLKDWSFNADYRKCLLGGGNCVFRP